ncbi:SGNH/GDSL hydrolase family protein [Clostridium estertheticum]|uniref:SGNH/GDSL hydrolase family protein n=1 Tax=Clostridium estertheticum TaxID=238834 RepID=UPI001CF55B0A|nr:SGNH/GDSL hydrolase family protein [Clostridium estertheticum]MCB2340488.1 GDSL-type esterase/lipase family protein [Clostridium estertheticum]
MIQSRGRSKKLFSIILIVIFIATSLFVSPQKVYASSNIAMGKTSTSDSELLGHGASNGNDGKQSTYWSAADTNDNHYWTVDLGGLYELKETEVKWQKNTVYKYRVETSTDNLHWTLRIDKSNNTSTIQKQKDIFNGLARYVKIIILDVPSNDYASICDFKVSGSAFKNNSPTMVYIAGDSTAQTYGTSFAPQTGWGQCIEKYFSRDVMFDNRAIGGRSSKSFILEGRLDDILSVIRPKDYLFIQFGHNDASYIPARHTDPYTTYKDYLKQYITKSRDIGAIPILITPVARLNYKNGVFVNDFPDYVIAMKQVAIETNTPIIDMMNTCIDYYTSVGYDTVFPNYLVSSNGTDYTHFTQAGANMIASMTTQKIKALNIPISKYVKNLNPNEKQINYKFDFGGVAEPGYTNVSASLEYNPSVGYGFNTPVNMKNVTASGSGAGSDAVQFLTFGTKSSNTFNVDLPNGLYEVAVTLGDTTRTSVAAEGVYQVMNMTGNGATDKFQIPITDGQLNILVTEGKAGKAFTLSALEITKISDKSKTNKTIYISGDSTVCNYYPIDTSLQCGWGQMLPQFLSNKEYQIRDMATGGQFARGFRDDGQFESIMKYIKKGDCFILEFGINDSKYETEAEFKEIMRDMIKQVKGKGAKVVLVTSQGKATDFDLNNVHSAVDKWYRHSTVALADEEKVPLIDLNVLSSKYYTSIGQEATAKLFMSDSLHPNRAGAIKLASIVASELKK